MYIRECLPKKNILDWFKALREVHNTMSVQIQGLIDFPKMLILILKVIHFT